MNLLFATSTKFESNKDLYYILKWIKDDGGRRRRQAWR